MVNGFTSTGVAARPCTSFSSGEPSEPRVDPRAATVETTETPMFAAGTFRCVT